MSTRLAVFGALAGAIVLSIAGACAPKREIKSQRLPDGSVRITCQTTLQACLDSADLICKGKTYDVLRARDQREQFGAELGTSQVEVRTSEAVIRCSGPGAGEPEGEGDPAAASPPAPRLAPAATLPPPSTAPPPPPARVCVPGSTQACVGPGACEGGQSCLPTGAGFGPCDCGTIGAPVPAPSPAPTAPAPAPSSSTTPPPAPAPPLTPRPPRPALTPPKKPKAPPLQPSATPLTPPSKAH